jgi:hypothetical protein
VREDIKEHTWRLGGSTQAREVTLAEENKIKVASQKENSTRSASPKEGIENKID